MIHFYMKSRFTFSCRINDTDTAQREKNWADRQADVISITNSSCHVTSFPRQLCQRYKKQRRIPIVRILRSISIALSTTLFLVSVTRPMRFFISLSLMHSCWTARPSSVRIRDIFNYQPEVTIPPSFPLLLSYQLPNISWPVIQNHSSSTLYDFPLGDMVSEFFPLLQFLCYRL